MTTTTPVATMTMAEALNTALGDALAADDQVVIFGEDVGTLGGVFRITDGLASRFGAERCFDTPIAESGIVGIAVGMAMGGFKPVIEMQFDAFAYPAFQQITSHVAKLRNRTLGRLTLPMVIRIPYGGGIGGLEHHCDSSEAYYTHTPGLKVVTPGCPGDAYGLLRQAIDDPDPVIFLEPKRLYWSKGDVDPQAARLPFETAVRRRHGGHITAVTYGPSLPVVLEAAAAAAADGIEIDVIDLRSLVPFDDQTVGASVARTGRCLVVTEEQGFGGFAAEVAARVQERCFHSLAAPVLRVTAFDVPYPPPKLEHAYLPDVERILDAVERLQLADDPDPRYLAS
jgi:2-oxoisovalerate dehydrogenase E1 component beta subunit